MRQARAVLTMLIGVLIAACAHTPPPSTLYDELGGADGIERVVSHLLQRSADNPLIAHHFIGVDLDNLQRQLSSLICAETGGPCTYGGQSMPDAHAGLDIQPDEFDAMVADLVAVLDQAGVAEPARQRLLSRLAQMQPEIVGQ